MKNQNRILFTCLLAFCGTSTSNGQDYNLVQTFENGGSGTDDCWTGYNVSGTPPSGTFYTQSNHVQSGSIAGGMFACCGGPAIPTPTYYTSPPLPAGDHTVTVYLMQSSQFNESFEIGITNNMTGSIFTPAFTKSVWPFPVAWEKSTVNISTTADLDRIAFRVPAANSKTYFLDSIVISNSGNSTASCTYTLVTGQSQNLVQNEAPMPFPNPFQNKIGFRLLEGTRYKLKLFDVTSKLVADQWISNETPNLLYNLKCGIYAYSLFDNRGFISKGRLIKD